jgi:hypothetical protein
MGNIKKPTIASYWSTLCSQATPWFGKTFTKHCFSHLVNNNRFPGPGEPDYDPCARYQPLMDHANRVLRHYYTPHQEITVNESLAGTKNKTSLMQYLPGESNFGCCVALCPTTDWWFPHREAPGLGKTRAT